MSRLDELKAKVSQYQQQPTKEEPKEEPKVNGLIVEVVPIKTVKPIQLQKNPSRNRQVIHSLPSYEVDILGLRPHANDENYRTGKHLKPYMKKANREWQKLIGIRGYYPPELWSVHDQAWVVNRSLEIKKEMEHKEYRTKNEPIEVNDLYAHGYTQSEIATMYNMSQAKVSKLIKVKQKRLTKEQRHDILVSSKSYQELANEYGVSKSAIQKIKQRGV